jgi:hypothetical protein
MGAIPKRRENRAEYRKGTPTKARTADTALGSFRNSIFLRQRKVRCIESRCLLMGAIRASFTGPPDYTSTPEVRRDGFFKGCLVKDVFNNN